jgi:hypothetical protein
MIFAQDNPRLITEQKIVKLESLISQKFAQDQMALNLWLKDMKIKMPQVNEGLLKTYYSLGILHARVYIKNSSGNESGEDLTHYQKALFYLKAIEPYEFNIDQVEDHLSKLETIRTERSKLARQIFGRLLVMYLSYQELALLKDSAGKEKITSSQRGPCLGGQVAYGNAYNEWSLDACAYVTSGNVGAKNTARYFQRDVASKGFYLKPTYWKILADSEAAIGLGIPILFRSVDYTEPTGARIESRRKLPVGLSLDGRWRMLTDLNLTTTMAVVDGPMLWTVGLMYQL